MVLDGPVNKSKLDKKIVEVEEDLSEFYLKGPRNWRETALSHPKENHFSSGYETGEYFEYAYEDRFNEEALQEEYEL